MNKRIFADAVEFYPIGPEYMKWVVNHDTGAIEMVDFEVGKLR